LQPVPPAMLLMLSTAAGASLVGISPSSALLSVMP
jgi:hypothetical protein